MGHLGRCVGPGLWVLLRCVCVFVTGLCVAVCSVQSGLTLLGKGHLTALANNVFLINIFIHKYKIKSATCSYFPKWGHGGLALGSQTPLPVLFDMATRPNQATSHSQDQLPGQNQKWTNKLTGSALGPLLDVIQGRCHHCFGGKNNKRALKGSGGRQANQQGARRPRESPGTRKLKSRFLFTAARCSTQPWVGIRK